MGPCYQARLRPFFFNTPPRKKIARRLTAIGGDWGNESPVPPHPPLRAAETLQATETRQAADTRQATGALQAAGEAVSSPSPAGYGDAGGRLKSISVAPAKAGGAPPGSGRGGGQRQYIVKTVLIVKVKYSDYST